MASKKFLHVVGARPQFVKLAPVYNQVGGVIVHTGQHYDDAMSRKFLETFKIEPHVNLGCRTVPDMVKGLVSVIGNENPNGVIIYGDTNSTLAGALAGKRYHSFVIHVEAGLRSGDWSMPEEVNRVVADNAAYIRFAPSQDAMDNLEQEGFWFGNHLVGNVMIDSLVKFQEHINVLYPQPYALLTLHRPSNVDDTDNIRALFNQLGCAGLDFIWPKHPRVKLPCFVPYNIKIIEPQDYVTSLSLQAYAKFVVTDSGGIQEETSYLGVPCLTLRPNTERPITITHGTNILVPTLASLLPEIDAIMAGIRKTRQEIPLWDGKAAERIAKILL